MSGARRGRTLLVVAALLAVAACGADPSGPAAPTGAARSAGATGAALSGSITVFAAASLSGTFPALGARFEQAHPGTTVRFSFGASSTLAQQITAGAPADVFASASTATMAKVTAAGAATDPETFATNVAQIAVSPASTGKVRSVADLADPGVTVALCQPQVPCGALAQQVLAKAGVSVHPVTEGLDVTSTLAYVTSGEADAAVVYVTDVRAAGAKVRAVDIPAADNASTAYPIATVTGTGKPALAAAFEQFVLSPDGRSVLAAAGFAAP